MPLIEIDADLYEYLRTQVSDFGETPSSILRRLLFPPGGDSPTGAPAPSPNPPNGHVETQATSKGSLAEFVTTPNVRYLNNDTNRYLAILGFVCRKDPTSFEKILQFGGRKRKYFGRSRDEIEQSGKNTHPKQIPDTDYWAMTNANTQQKAEMLRNVLRVLGYPPREIRVAEETISKVQAYSLDDFSTPGEIQAAEKT